MKLKKVKLNIHPLFIILAIITVIRGDAFKFVSYMLAVILHEYGHAFVAKRLGYALGEVCLQPYGAQLNLKANILRQKDEILIAIAGPITNIICLVLTLALWWLFPTMYYYTEYFAYASFITAAFNILPLLPLDGSRVVLALFEAKNKRKNAYKTLIFLNFFASFAFLIFFAFSIILHAINFTLLIMAIFIASGTINIDKDCNYTYLFAIEKSDFIKSKAIPIKYFALNKNFKAKDLYKLVSPSYYAIVYVLDDQMRPVKRLAESDFEKVITSL